MKTVTKKNTAPLRRKSVLQGQCYRLVNSLSKHDGELYIATSTKSIVNLRDGGVRSTFGRVVDSDRWVAVNATVVENYNE